ncbi:helix-turn-helix transcriptional regulator [Variovorax sp. RB3P1]|uniref:helix-turn-helix transcriptional regulator n=1 Tax=Variovorax sp. RB3P1 TaxID=3443732 RepID=UPI003F47DE7C
MTSKNLQAAPTDIHALMRVIAVISARGIQKSQHYLDVQNGLYTPPLKIGKHASAWPAREVEILNAARIAGKSDDDIRVLVQQLMAARAALAAKLEADYGALAA